MAETEKPRFSAAKDAVREFIDLHGSFDFNKLIDYLRKRGLVVESDKPYFYILRVYGGIAFDNYVMMLDLRDGKFPRAYETCGSGGRIEIPIEEFSPPGRRLRVIYLRMRDFFAKITSLFS